MRSGQRWDEVATLIEWVLQLVQPQAVEIIETTDKEVAILFTMEATSTAIEKIKERFNGRDNKSETS